MAKALRVAALLFVLASVAVGAWRTRTLTTEWKRTLEVVIYPINGDARPSTSAYLATLEPAAFAPIVEFLHREAQRYGLALNYPIDVKLGPRVNAMPPAMPAGRAAPEVMLWSLQLRFWAWRHDAYSGPRPDVRVFAMYFDPALTPRLEHSVGLKEGLVGIARVFAAAHMTSENAVIIAHEILHTFGATDKYDPASGQPVVPDGLADPAQVPLYPQQMAEIMGGRIALSEARAETPQSLELAVIGPRTAAEINWAR